MIVVADTGPLHYLIPLDYAELLHRFYGEGWLWFQTLSPSNFHHHRRRIQFAIGWHALGNLWRRLVLPRRIDSWSLTSLQQRLVKTDRRLAA